MRKPGFPYPRRHLLSNIVPRASTIDAMAICMIFPSRSKLLLLLTLLLPAALLRAQDNVFTGTNTGADRVRIAAADFKAGSPDAAVLKRTFDAVLFSDLGNAGVCRSCLEEPAATGNARGSE